MLSSVSYHAILRYLERVLGLPVDTWLVGMDTVPEGKRVDHACQCAGLPVDYVRELILCPTVRTALACGFKQVVVRVDGFSYVIENSKIVTVLAHGMRSKVHRPGRKWSRRDLRKLAESAE